MSHRRLPSVGVCIIPGSILFQFNIVNQLARAARRLALTYSTTPEWNWKQFRNSDNASALLPNNNKHKIRLFVLQEIGVKQNLLVFLFSVSIRGGCSCYYILRTAWSTTDVSDGEFLETIKRNSAESLFPHASRHDNTSTPLANDNGHQPIRGNDWRKRRWWTFGASSPRDDIPRHIIFSNGEIHKGVAARRYPSIRSHPPSSFFPPFFLRNKQDCGRLDNNRFVKGLLLRHNSSLLLNPTRREGEKKAIGSLIPTHPALSQGNQIN